MKCRLLFWMGILVAASLACQTVQLTLAPAPTATPTVTLTPEPLPTSTLTPLPTLQPITCTDDSCLQACLDRIKVVLAAQPFASLSEGADESRVVDLAKYKVKGDAIQPLSKLGVPAAYLPYQQDLEAHNRIWNYFTAILPSSQRKWITEYLVFTDGKSGIQAWVRRSPGNPQVWSLGADILDSRNPILLTDTLLHEFGHLLTLNTDQLTFSPRYDYAPRPGRGDCPQYSTNEGCLNEASYLNQFYLQFWQRIYPEWYENVHEASRGMDWALVNGFHDRYPQEFNTVYSAASPEEDMAESFSIFVLNPKPADDRLADQKVLFYYAYPELVELRTAIIQGICAYVQE